MTDISILEINLRKNGKVIWAFTGVENVHANAGAPDENHYL